MKLLTKVEYEMLVDAASECSGGIAAADRSPINFAELAALMVEQGRVTVRRCLACPAMRHAYITPAGREALKLWPLLIERGLVSP